MAIFDQVVKVYPLGPLGRRQVKAVDGVSLSIRRGEVFGLLGPNRAGKTTLIKLLLSLCHPTSGTITRLGQPLRDRRTLARIGYVHENHAFPRYLTPMGLLHYYGALSMIAPPELNRRVPRLLERVGLSDRGNDPISGFSKGCCNASAWLRLSSTIPSCSFSTNPMKGWTCSGVRSWPRSWRSSVNGGHSVILVSHVLPEVEQFCDRIGVVVAGQLCYQGDLQTFLNPKNSPPRTLDEALRPLYARQPL